MRITTLLLALIVALPLHCLFAQAQPEINYSYQVYNLDSLISLPKSFSRRDYCYSERTGVLFIRKSILDSVVYKVSIAEKFEIADSILFPYTTQQDIFSSIVLHDDCLLFLCSSPPSVDYGMKVYSIIQLNEPIYEYKYNLINPPKFDLCTQLTKDSIVLMDILRSSVSIGYISMELTTTPNQVMYSLKPLEGFSNLPKVLASDQAFSFFALISDNIYLITHRTGWLTVIDQNGMACLTISIPADIYNVKLINNGLTWFSEGNFCVLEFI